MRAGRVEPGGHPFEEARLALTVRGFVCAARFSDPFGNIPAHGRCTAAG